MKAKELMIGDWMYNCIADIRFQVYPQFFSQWYNRSEQFRTTIQPIPLTPEILEKNGWVRDLYSFESYDNEELECLSLWVGEDGKNKWWWHVGVELVTPINHVHELQHALRLCGREKKIIL